MMGKIEMEREKNRQMRAVLDMIHDPERIAARRLQLQNTAVVEPPDTNAQIHNLLYEALEAIDAPLDLLQIVGSMGDTQSEAETLAQLEAFIAREREE